MNSGMLATPATPTPVTPADFAAPFYASGHSLYSLGLGPEVGPPDDARRIGYLPSPREIAKACAHIRAGWTRCERRRRFVGGLLPDDTVLGWQPPLIDTSHFRSAREGGSEGR